MNISKNETVKLDELDGYKLEFSGKLIDINEALDLFEYKPICFSDTDNTLTVNIIAQT